MPALSHDQPHSGAKDLAQSSRHLAFFLNQARLVQQGAMAQQRATMLKRVEHSLAAAIKVERHAARSRKRYERQRAREREDVAFCLYCTKDRQGAIFHLCLQEIVSPLARSAGRDSAWTSAGSIPADSQRAYNGDMQRARRRHCNQSAHEGGEDLAALVSNARGPPGERNALLGALASRLPENR